MKNLAFDWNDLKFFLAVAREGGLSGAAEVLGTSPSTVSRHVAALEERLGANLFLRQQSGYLLTDDGSELLKHIEQVEQAMMVAERNGHLPAHQDVSGQVRLATTDSLTLYLIVPHLRDFHRRYPNLQVEIKTGLTLANLSQREADLALRTIAPNPEDGAGDYIASRVGKLNYAMYCAAGMLPPAAVEAEGDTEWQALDYVSWDESCPDLAMAKWLRAAFPHKRPMLACNNLEAQCVAVRAGVGVGLLPCFIGERDPALQRIGAPSVLARDLWLVYHRDLKASQRVIAMRDFIIELIDTHFSCA